MRWFPMHHTLFKTLARLLGLILGDFYRGFILLDMITSALALVSLWWWLRALVPSGAGGGRGPDAGRRPDFWGYGAVAGNYTAIVARRVVLDGGGDPRPSPTDALASLRGGGRPRLGTGYRADIGLFWLPVFMVILWQHRWKRAIARRGRLSC